MYITGYFDRVSKNMFGSPNPNYKNIKDTRGKLQPLFQESIRKLDFP